MFIKEGGNATTKTGETASKINLAEFSPKQYKEFKIDLIKIIKEINIAYKKYAGEFLWKNINEIDNFNVFSGSGNSFFKRDREEFIKVKPKMGDIDVQIDTEKRDVVKRFLEHIVGETFAGFKFLGTSFHGDFYNVLEAPEKYQPQATNIQIDFEFVAFDENGNIKEFEIFSKNSDWEDMKQGIKGVAKQTLIPCIYKALYGRKGVLLQNKKNLPTKDQKNGVFPTLSYGIKGSREKYKPVYDETGKQFEYEGQPAFREYSVKDTGTNQNLDKIFEEMFNTKASPEERKLMYTYIGMLKLIKKYFNKQTIQKIYEFYEDFLPDNLDSEEAINIILNKFKEVFPYVISVKENYNFNTYVQVQLM